jgi:hypothetical protein
VLSQASQQTTSCRVGNCLIVLPMLLLYSCVLSKHVARYRTACLYGSVIFNVSATAAVLHHTTSCVSLLAVHKEGLCTFWFCALCSEPMQALIVVLCSLGVISPIPRNMWVYLWCTVLCAGIWCGAVQSGLCQTHPSQPVGVCKSACSRPLSATP